MVLTGSNLQSHINVLPVAKWVASKTFSLNARFSDENTIFFGFLEIIKNPLQNFKKI